MSMIWKQLCLAVILGLSLSTSGCLHTGCGWGCGPWQSCGTCQQPCGSECQTQACGTESCGECGSGCGSGCGNFLADLDFCLFGWACRKSNAIPDTLPLGSTVRAHDQVMQTNAEAFDFVFNQHDFIAQTAQLTPEGRDKVLEVAARMRSTPFPVIVERTDNNSDPELDALRRNLVALVLSDLGNADAQQRTIVSTSYGPGYTGRRAEQMYYQHISTGGNNNNNGNNGGGFGGGGGGGGFGGGGGGF